MNKKPSEFSGVISAMITPCSRPGEPDSGMMERLSGILSDRGCHGLFVLSSTGELPLLDEEQRRKMVKAAKKGAASGTKIYAGISGFGIDQTIRNIRNAEQDGADAAVIMAPFFVKISQPELTEYCRKIADASPLPLTVYNHFRMPSIFEVETLQELAEHPMIVALKDTDINLDNSLSRLKGISLLPMSFFQGREPFLSDSFSSGAEGCVCALANVAPEAHRNLYEAIKAGNPEAARKYQDQINSLGRLFRLKESGESISGFVYTLLKVAELRGWIDKPSHLLPGFRPDKDFNDRIIRIFQESGITG